jgi:hypothetical protein
MNDYTDDIPPAEDVEDRALHALLLAVAAFIDVQRHVQPEAAYELTEAAAFATIDVHIRIPTPGERGHVRCFARDLADDSHLVREVAFVGRRSGSAPQ